MSKFIFRTFSSVCKFNQILNKVECTQRANSSLLSGLFGRKYYSTGGTDSEANSGPRNEQPLADKSNLSNESNELKSEASSAEPKLANHFETCKANPIGKDLGWQPTAETHSSLLIDGVPYNKLPYVAIKATRNNTILTLCDANGLVMYFTSAGCCGFKNAKKSTAIAGQAAGLALSDNAKRRGITNVRVIVKGFGNGRLSSIKALQLGKLNVVSITDNTVVPMPFARPPRPPAKRKI